MCGFWVSAVTAQKRINLMALASLTFFLFCLFNQTAFAQERVEIVQTTVSELLADPWAFDGQRVRVSGTFTECTSGFSCKICESTEPVDPPIMEVETQCLDVDFVEDLLTKIARFSTANIEAKFKAECTGAPHPFKNDNHGNPLQTMCIPPRTLIDATIIGVKTHRPPTAGYLVEPDDYYSRELINTSDRDAAELTQSFLDHLPSYSGITATDVYFTFLLPKSVFTEWLAEGEELVKGDLGYHPLGGVCVCLDEFEMCPKPGLLGHVNLQTIKMPYSCHIAEKRGGLWHFSEVN